MKKKIIISFAIAILITIIPYIIISVYSRPSADDFAYSAEVYNVIRNGNYSLFDILKAAINTDVRYYFTWQGLYSSVLLLALQPGVFGEQYYYIGTIIMMLLMYVSIYYFVDTILKHYSINKKPFFISLCVFAVMIHGMPSTVEGLYWFNGVFNYLPFLFLTMVNIALLVKFYDHKKIKYIILSCILSFIISGGNHVTAFMNILILLFGLVFMFYKNRSYIYIYIIYPLLSALIGFVIMFVAPGTKVRMDYHEKESIITTLIGTAVRFVKNVFMFSDLKLIGLFIVLIPLALEIKKHIKTYRLHPLVVLIIFSIVSCGMLAVPFYVLGHFGSGRIEDVYYMSHIVFACCLFVYCVLYYSNKYEHINSFLNGIKEKHVVFILGLACIAICLFNSNLFSITDDLISGRAQNFAEECDKRFDLCKTHSGNETLIVEPLPQCKNLFFDDITSDVNDWRNDGYYEYYGVKIKIND